MPSLGIYYQHLNIFPAGSQVHISAHDHPGLDPAGGKLYTSIQGPGEIIGNH